MGMVVSPRLFPKILKECGSIYLTDPLSLGLMFFCASYRSLCIWLLHSEHDVPVVADQSLSGRLHVLTLCWCLICIQIFTMRWSLRVRTYVL